jgi:2'-5' RNA ligase
MASTVTAAIDFEDVGDSNGLYAWAIPDEGSTNALLRMLRSAPFKTYDGTELHCTIMHSRDFPQQASHVEDRACTAVLEAFVTWQDHKDRTIVVASLSSPDLEDIHRELVTQGCTHGYPEYNPHITVAKDVELEPLSRLWITKVNEWLASNEVIIKFSPQLRATPLG